MKKKLTALALATALTLSISACGQTSSSSTPSGSDSAQPAKTTYTVGIAQLVQHPALDAATQGFQDALREKLGSDVVFDLQNASGDATTCSVIANQFTAAGVDLILANATPALQAAQAATNQIPILGTSVTDYATALGLDTWSSTTGTNISGTSDLAPLEQQAIMMKQLFPEARKVGILYCSAEPNSQFQAAVITMHLEDFGYTVNEYSFTDSNDIHAVTTGAAADSDVIYIPTDNTAASNTEIIRNIVVPAGVPVFAGEEGICKGTGVATLSISYYDLGVATGEMAYEILVNGADPATMEIRYAPKFTKLYNPELAEQLGITLPADYQAIDMGA